MARVKYTQSIVASVSRAAGAAATRGAIDVRERDGGIVTMKITNSGALGAQCECRLMVSHADGATPAVDAAGTDWKTIWKFGGGTTNGVVTEQSYEFGPAVKHLQIEFVGNTTNAAVVEAIASTVNYSG